jgi:hypothetical protein
MSSPEFDTIDDLRWAVAMHTNNVHLINDHTLERLLATFDHIYITFNRRIKGMITCEVTNYYGGTYSATAIDHIDAAYLAILKMHTQPQCEVMKDDYYQRYI